MSMTCTYSSGKYCKEPRTQKKNGTLHKFCAEHQRRAAIRQRVRDGRKRLQKVQDRRNKLFNDITTMAHSTQPIDNIKNGMFHNCSTFTSAEIEALISCLFY